MSNDDVESVVIWSRAAGSLLWLRLCTHYIWAFMGPLHPFSHAGGEEVAEEASGSKHEAQHDGVLGKDVRLEAVQEHVPEIQIYAGRCKEV